MNTSTTIEPVRNRIPTQGQPHQLPTRLGDSTIAQHGFYARPRLRRWSIVRFATFDHSVIAFWFATPRTPPLWQRDFFLINCLQLRSLSASVRSGVVKTFRCVTQTIEPPADRPAISHRGLVRSPRRDDPGLTRQRRRWLRTPS